MSSPIHSEQELLARISELETELKQIKKQKKYGLVWENHTEDVVLQCQNNVPILKEVKSRKIVDKDNTKPTNILIEGDNYHALSVLNYTHRGKVDVIYIDPPYNTGNKDFIYNDNYIDREDAYRHSKWLSFMEKRLLLAKELLSESGVIFISIDDNEQAQLKLLCDSVFGEGNFISILKWKRKKQPSFLHNQVASVMEYIFVYSKNINSVTKLSVEKISGDDKPIFNSSNNISVRLFKKGIKSKILDTVIKKGIYKIRTSELEYLDDVIIKNGRTQNEFSIKARFRDGQPNINYYCDNDLVFITNNFTLRRDVSDLEKEKSKPIIDLILDWGQNQDAFEELLNLFDEKDIFNNPKPVLLIKNLVLASSVENSIVLDFFAGSGTTGHAVMELNKDGGNRQFILCTNNENNICEEVTYERIKRVMKGYKNKKGETVEGLGGNLRYFKTELCDVGKLSRVTDDKKLALTYRVGGLLALKENTFEETEHTDHWQIFSEHDTCTAVYFSEDKTKLHELIEKLGSYKTPVKLYVFSWSKNEYASELSDYPHITALDIPEPILAVYREINNL